MKLINCPHCSKEVSDTAYDCVGCGGMLKRPKRGAFGKIIKWAFILFNILMALWIVSGSMNASDVIDSTSNQYEQAGAQIGTAIGVGLLLFLWVIGDIILGFLVLFTRPKK